MNQIVRPTPASNTLLAPYRLGKLELPNRLVMAPLTRNRAAAGNVPTALMAEYYTQRASAGLLISEATQVSPDGQGYEATPGIHSPQQIEGWRNVTDAIHQKGGRIFLQLWHVGRVSHVSLQPDGRAPVAPSAIRAKTKTFVGGNFTDVSEPRALLRSELPGIVDAFRQGAINALDAGFDGVEIHGANGYLLDQFLRDGANKRDDDYGGSIANRARLMLEVLAAVIAEAGAERVGIRLSPVTPANDMSDSNPQAVFDYLIPQIDRLAPVYIHVIEGATGGARDFAPFDYAAVRRQFRGSYVANNAYTPVSARVAVESEAADLIAFGKTYLANPDLAERVRLDAPLNAPDKATFYGGGARGYTDYPALAPQPVA